ncbi:hypothetical protein ACVWZK_003084 [Bradyrhizobium sp. GM0.4]
MKKVRIPTDPPGRLAFVGQALYGDRWRKRLADALRISRSTLRCWLLGIREAECDIDCELLNLLDRERDLSAERVGEITALRRRILEGGRV